MPIKEIFARQILDCLGEPTIEVDLLSDLGLFRASVPTGTKVGKYEATILRDNDKNYYFGKSVQKAVDNINDIIAPAIIREEFECTRQADIDKFMIDLDGTEDKSKLGANAILAVSIVVAKAGASKRGLPLYCHIADLAKNDEFILPVPAFNLISGGKNSCNKIFLQDFMVLPIGAETFAEALRIGTEIYQCIKTMVKKKYKTACVADEGTFEPIKMKKPQQALKLLKTAIKKVKYTDKVNIAIDAAASMFYTKGKYNIGFKTKKKSKKSMLDFKKMLKMYQTCIKKFAVVSIEDPFAQDDWKSWSQMMKKCNIQIVGDHLTATNPKRVEMAIENEACNCLLLQLNQIGTITEAIEAYKLARQNEWGIMVGNRSGETEDTFIADLVVGLSAGQIKTGAPCRSELLSKYNRLLRIEEELGKNGKYAGRFFRNPMKMKEQSEEEENAEIEVEVCQV